MEIITEDARCKLHGLVGLVVVMLKVIQRSWRLPQRDGEVCEALPSLDLFEE